MYQAKTALFLYCVSPVHMGAGTAVGLIDNPIQRERHTDYPLFAGSGLKGAVRHWHWAQFDEDTRKDKKRRRETLLNRFFGPESDDEELYAGAVSVGDAQLVAFPVRCTKRAYVYATSPAALARTNRLLRLTLGDKAPAWPALDVASGHCAIVNPDLLSGDKRDKLYLEVFELTASVNQDLMKVSEWLAGHALPANDAYGFFQQKIKADLVLLPDEDFGYFVKNATVVEPHVRIVNETGTAAEGGLFYTENLPPESLLVAPLMATAERSGKGGMKAEEVLATVVRGGDGMNGLHGQLVQVGGDATTGRGQIVVTAVEG